MNKTKVALIRCEKYDDAQVIHSIKKGMDLLGGTSLFVKPGDKIVLKPNVLIGSDPDKCVTTHPLLYSEQWAAHSKKLGLLFLMETRHLLENPSLV